MMDILTEAALLLGEESLPDCETIEDSLEQLKIKLESDGCEITDDYINTDDPSLYVKLTSGINIKFGPVDTTLDPWDDPEMIQIDIYYTDNLSYADESILKKWYEIDVEYLETEFTK